MFFYPSIIRKNTDIIIARRRNFSNSSAAFGSTTTRDNCDSSSPSPPPHSSPHSSTENHQSTHHRHRQYQDQESASPISPPVGIFTQFLRQVSKHLYILNKFSCTPTCTSSSTSCHGFHLNRKNRKKKGEKADSPPIPFLHTRSSTSQSIGTTQTGASAASTLTESSFSNTAISSTGAVGETVLEEEKTKTVDTIPIQVPYPLTKKNEPRKNMGLLRKFRKNYFRAGGTHKIHNAYKNDNYSSYQDENNSSSGNSDNDDITFTSYDMTEITSFTTEDEDDQQSVIRENIHVPLHKRVTTSNNNKNSYNRRRRRRRIGLSSAVNDNTSSPLPTIPSTNEYHQEQDHKYPLSSPLCVEIEVDVPSARLCAGRIRKMPPLEEEAAFPADALPLTGEIVAMDEEDFWSYPDPDFVLDISEETSSCDISDEVIEDAGKVTTTTTNDNNDNEENNEQFQDAFQGMLIDFSQPNTLEPSKADDDDEYLVSSPENCGTMCLPRPSSRITPQLSSHSLGQDQPSLMSPQHHQQQQQQPQLTLPTYSSQPMSPLAHIYHEELSTLYEGSDDNASLTSLDASVVEGQPIAIKRFVLSTAIEGENEDDEEDENDRKKDTNEKKKSRTPPRVSTREKSIRDRWNNILEMTISGQCAAGAKVVPIDPDGDHYDEGEI